MESWSGLEPAAQGNGILNFFVGSGAGTPARCLYSLRSRRGYGRTDKERTIANFFQQSCESALKMQNKNKPNKESLIVVQSRFQGGRGVVLSSPEVVLRRSWDFPWWSGTGP